MSVFMSEISAQAYVGCLSGAEMKHRYLQLIEEAGFEEVKIVEENCFPVENMANDPIEQAIVKTTEMPAGVLNISPGTRTLFFHCIYKGVCVLWSGNVLL